MRQFEKTPALEQIPRIRKVNGGHMSYERLLIDSPERGSQFVKLHDPSTFTDSIRERHSREYLIKEHTMMQHLRDQDFIHVPSHSRMIGDYGLVMQGLPPDESWHWKAPDLELGSYIETVLDALEELENTQPPDDFLDSHKPAHIALIEEGWKSLDTASLEHVAVKLGSILADLTPNFQQDALHLIGNLASLGGREISATPKKFAHHDLRQANLAWHPHHGVRLVDWSWAGLGLEKADRTSLLIDLHKSGHSINSHLEEHFNIDHAHLLLGFLLARSIAPGRNEDSTVRFHQAVSAISTYSLMARSEIA